MAHHVENLLHLLFRVTICIALLKSIDAALRECEEKEGRHFQKDFHFEYTECDKQGGRWRVAVPQPDQCVGGHPPPPVRGRDCSFSCRPGTFLDLSSQECKPCLPGTYSLGGGVRYDEFPTGKHLPQGFRVVNEVISLASLQAGIPAGDIEGNIDQSSTNCEGTGWQIRANTLTYIPGTCLSTLMYSVKLVRPGYVKYKYLYPDGGIFFAFQVQNDQCISVNDANLGKHMFPPTTTEAAWREEKVMLTSGQLLLSWKAMVLHGQHKPIKIKGIEIRGVAYAQECSPCPNGTYSRGNSGYCQPCPSNTYSGMKASKCLPCDNRTQFSGIQASKCEQRPPCTVSDYYSLHGPCNWNRKSIIEYRWTEPKICRDDIKGAVALPLALPNVDCPPCNPGTYMLNGHCHICPGGHYSSGIGECKRCPANTAPDRGYNFVWWNEMPDKIASSCQTMDEGNCDVHEGWLPLGDRISTSRSRRSDLYLTLSLRVLGYKSTSLASMMTSAGAVGTISFVFDTTCVGDCGFYFIEVSSTGKPTILSEWNGTLPKQAMKYPVMNANGTIYQWVFIRSQITEDVSTDQASIYVINVTNTVDGGAAGCIPCPMNMETLECIPCPSGHYIQNITGNCVQCPKDTFLKGLPSEGMKACAKCGLNTQSNDGTECTASCHLKMNNATFDLRPLKGFIQAKGVEIFSREGSSYFHLFNVSICQSSKAVCNDTMSQRNQGATLPVSSAVCRVTSLPTANETLFVNPLGLGDRLLAVSDNAHLFHGLQIPKGLVEAWQLPQIYFLYESFAISRTCSGGYHTMIIFRCDPAVKVSRATLPSTCPDGTCDGCLYQIVITSRYACPICSQQDYKEIVGECVGGIQKIHRIPARHCILIGKDLTETRMVECSEISVQMQATIGAATAIGAVLFILVLLIWKKNQRLEYKYMKLVENSTGKDDNLSAAESCALNEGEEDTSGPMVDKIVFLKTKPKMRSEKRRREEWDSYENVALAPSGEGNF